MAGAKVVIQEHFETLRAQDSRCMASDITCATNHQHRQLLPPCETVCARVPFCGFPARNRTASDPGQLLGGQMTGFGPRSPRSDDVVAIKVHYFVPSSRELVYKRLLRV